MTNDEIIAAIRRARGILSAAARDLGVSRQALYHRLRRNAALLEALEHEREAIVDLAEQKLIEALEGGERWAIALTLTRLGRWRGWGDATFAEAPEERAHNAERQARHYDAMAALEDEIATLSPKRRGA